MKEGRGQRSNGREGMGREREGCIIAIVNEHSIRDEVPMKARTNTWSVQSFLITLCAYNTHYSQEPPFCGTPSFSFSSSFIFLLLLSL